LLVCTVGGNPELFFINLVNEALRRLVDIGHNNTTTSSDPEFPGIVICLMLFTFRVRIFTSYRNSFTLNRLSMPVMPKLFTTLLLTLSIMTSTGFMNSALELPEELAGAWQAKNEAGEQVLVFVDNYMTHTIYSVRDKKFIATRGGTCESSGGKLNINFEFSTPNKEEVGTKASYGYSVSNNQLTVELGGSKTTFTRLDDGKGGLAGNWQITGRVQDGKMNEMRPGARKTIKILSGSRFQWAAINTETKEFFGSGGGTYTFTNGKYTENIDFFSRDSSRVGAALSFDGAVEDGKWIHKGLSSRGEPIHEIWSRPSLKP
jgi:hypothetical protein